MSPFQISPHFQKQWEIKKSFRFMHETAVESDKILKQRHVLRIKLKFFQFREFKRSLSNTSRTWLIISPCKKSQAFLPNPKPTWFSRKSEFKIRETMHRRSKFKSSLPEVWRINFNLSRFFFLLIFPVFKGWTLSVPGFLLLIGRFSRPMIYRKTLNVKNL